MKIGSKIGRPIRVDQATSLVSRGKFARICVEVDIPKPLLTKFMLRIKVRKIEYKGIHLICFKCGVYGHHQENCTGSEKVITQAAETIPMRQGGEEHTQNRKESIPAEITEKFGPWMMVMRSSRRFDNNNQGRATKSGKQESEVTSDIIPIKQNRPLGQSRYEVLRQQENQERPLEYGPGKTDGDPIKEGKPNVQVNYKIDHSMKNSGNTYTNKEKQGQIWNSNKESMGSHHRQRRDAEAKEHVFVRGSQGGKQIFQEAINHVPYNEAWENSIILENAMGEEHHQDPYIHRNTFEDALMEHEGENMDEEIVQETLFGEPHPHQS